jgi:hypothetical protein
MALGEKTKCDLSGGLAKLDLQALTNQTEIHFYTILSSIEKKVQEVKYDTVTEKTRKDRVLSMVSTGSREIIRLTNRLAEVAEVLHTLYHTDDRKIEIVREDE